MLCFWPLNTSEQRTGVATTIEIPTKTFIGEQGATGVEIENH